MTSYKRGTTTSAEEDGGYRTPWGGEEEKGGGGCGRRGLPEANEVGGDWYWFAGVIDFRCSFALACNVSFVVFGVARVSFYRQGIQSPTRASE